MAQCSAMAKLLDLGGLDILAMDDGDDDDEDEFFFHLSNLAPQNRQHPYGQAAVKAALQDALSSMG